MVQGATGTVTVLFKEFGVRLNFTPTIAGDAIRLKVRPEVSSLDFNNGITLSGFRIPALITRRAETDVELRDGQSFAIAGLLNNIAQNDGTAIPIPEQAADHRRAVQGQVRSRGTDRADGAGHAAAGSCRSTRTKSRRCRRTPGEFLPPPEQRACRSGEQTVDARSSAGAAWIQPKARERQ